MEQRPILFSTPMVQAILAGRKTQTRRKADMTSRHIRKLFNGEFEGESGRIYKCPYGQVGDVLWVRETWQWDWIDCDKKEEKCYFFKTSTLPNVLASGEKWKPSIHMPKDAARIWLRINNVRVERLNDISEEDAIKEGIEELKSNGIPHYRNYGKQLVAKEFNFFCSPVNSFRSLWESINGENSWNNNPWVWVIEFEGIEKPNNC